MAGEEIDQRRKTKKSPPRKKKPGPIINGWTDLGEASFGLLHTDSGEADAMHGFKGSFIVPLLYTSVSPVHNAQVC